MSVILHDKFSDPETFWMTVSTLRAMAIDPECNHRLTEYAWYSIWTTIFMDLAAGMHARAPSQVHIFSPAPQFCLWAPRTTRPVRLQPAIELDELSASQSPPPSAVPTGNPASANALFPSPPALPSEGESITANFAENCDKPSATSTRSTEVPQPRDCRLPDISMLGITSTFLEGGVHNSLHERRITKFTVPIILEVKPEPGTEFGLDLKRAQAEVVEQAKFLFAAYEQNVVIGIAAVGLAFRYAILRRNAGFASTASELRDPDYNDAPDNLETSQDWCPMSTFGKGHFLRTLRTIVRTAFEEVLALPYERQVPFANLVNILRR
ncbi:hypothetical protein CCMSSC00406_0007259 [Pleurotus cornucopiae]|uniref:Uncharacterized protein n=1 Tax=Pleurotus cornucopiae TaxID=5321 RepID=A0ACB7IL14_PLECO|nr:hypothetical protein CCMSSC00406_0007259 [Pleurotus cornucopiae]